MTSRDQLGSVFQPLIVLLQNFDQGLTFSWSKTTNKLNQICCVWVVDGTIDIDTHFISSVYKFEVESLQKFFLRQLILQRMVFETEDFFVGIAQLRVLNEGILNSRKFIVNSTWSMNLNY